MDQRVAQHTLHWLDISLARNLKIHINAYVLFCNEYSLIMFPTDVLQMHRYATHLSEMCKSVDSIKNYICGVRTLHLLLGFVALPYEDYLYQLMIQGLRQDKAHVVRRHTGIIGIVHRVRRCF